MDYSEDYSSYKDLKVRLLEPGILEITMGEEGKLAVATENAHAEMARIWLDVDRDPETRVAILRGAGKGFSAGGDLAMVEEMTQDFDRARARLARGARSRLQHDQLLEDHRLGDARPGGRRRPRRGPARRHLDRGEQRAPHRRPHAAGRRGRRPRGDRLAAPLRHGEGEVLPAHSARRSAARRRSASASSR